MKNVTMIKWNKNDEDLLKHLEQYKEETYSTYCGIIRLALKEFFERKYGVKRSK
jgi:hypothetical protein